MATFDWGVVMNNRQVEQVGASQGALERTKPGGQGDASPLSNCSRERLSLAVDHFLVHWEDG